VNGILDMSKIDTGEFVISPEPFAPAPVIRNCCALFALKAADAGLEIKLELADNLPEINADQRALKQILINLLSNGIKFTDRGGRLIVSAKVEAGDILVAVEDNGVGIGAEDLTRLGDQFFQARGSYDRRHDGTGLGLSIVKGLVALHAGQVLVRSTPGKGTCFTVRLPLDCEKARAATPANKIVHHLVIEPPPASAPATDRDTHIPVKISA